MRQSQIGAVRRFRMTRGFSRGARIVRSACVAAALSVPALVSFAQQNPDAGRSGVAQARECAALSSDVARLACYDALLGAGSAAEAAAPRGEGATPPPPPAPAAGAPPAPRGGEAAAAASAAAAAGAGAPPAAPPAAQAPPAEPARPTRPSREVVEIEPYAVTVVDIPRERPEFVFVTDEGEVWVQTDGRRVVLPDVPFTAEIRPGLLGSYFLAPESGGRAIRVRLQ